MDEDSETSYDISEEDALRGQCYALLARVLSAPPNDEMLALVAGLKGDESELGQALSALAEVARHTTIQRIDDEYHELFIGVGRGELVPFGSYYLTGFLHEKPLANLRQDMGRLGIAQADDVHEPEDHIASVCEMMFGLIEGSFGSPVPLTEQRRFFEAHLGSWAPKFFEDLEAAKAAVFYMPVGRIGRLFMQVENAAFEMAA